MATDEVKRTAVQGIWEATEFTAGDDTPFVSVEEVAATVSLSAQHGSTRLFGVTLQGDTEQPPKVICYTGNGPRSEAHAHAIVLAVNCHEELVDIARTIVTVCDEGSQSVRELACCEGSPLVEACRELLSKIGRKAIEPAEPKP